jgi:hypothetical protein
MLTLTDLKVPSPATGKSRVRKFSPKLRQCLVRDTDAGWSDGGNPNWVDSIGWSGYEPEISRDVSSTQPRDRRGYVQERIYDNPPRLS